MTKEVVLDNEFFKIVKVTGTTEDGKPSREIYWHQYQSTESTCEELIRLYKLAKEL